jgi:hypothetical protein
MPRVFFILAVLTLLAAPLAAQTRSDLPPVPDARPPAMVPLDLSLEPQVTIIKREGAIVEEHRVNGKLYKVKVTPEHGVPYTLIDNKGDGSFVPLETPGTPQLSVPMWVIGTF